MPPGHFGMKLAETLRSCGFTQGVIDPQIWRKFKPGKATGSTSQLKPQLVRSTNLSPEEDESVFTPGRERKMDIGEEILGKDVCASPPLTLTISKDLETNLLRMSY